MNKKERILELEEALGPNYCFQSDPYTMCDYWIGLRVHKKYSGYEGHTIRTCCPEDSNIYWTVLVIRFLVSHYQLGDGDGYHRKFFHNISTLADIKNVVHQYPTNWLLIQNKDRNNRYYLE